MKRAVACAALVPMVAVVAPASAQACSRVMLMAQPVAPAAAASFVQTAAPVPLQTTFGYPSSTLTSVSYGVARLKPGAPPKLGATLPPEAGTLVESGQLSYDAASGQWVGTGNASGWAQTPGEYVWQVTAKQDIPATLPTQGPDGVWTGTSCDSPVAYTLTYDGTWSHRFSVLGASALTVKAGKADRAGQAKVSGTIAKAFPGKVRLTVACPGKRERTTFVPVKKGDWSRRVNAKRGCEIEASVAARSGWAASEASARVS